MLVISCRLMNAVAASRKLDTVQLAPRGNQSRISCSVTGVSKDRPAIAAAITSLWSNGQTEGHIPKLKLVKRQMYGRGRLDLLEARVIGPL
jgi:transposase